MHSYLLETVCVVVGSSICFASLFELLTSSDLGVEIAVYFRVSHQLMQPEVGWGLISPEFVISRWAPRSCTFYSASLYFGLFLGSLTSFVLLLWSLLTTKSWYQIILMVLWVNIDDICPVSRIPLKYIRRNILIHFFNGLSSNNPEFYSNRFIKYWKNPKCISVKCKMKL